MRGQGIYADQISQLFHVACRKAGLPEGGEPDLSTAAFRQPGKKMQLALSLPPQ